MTRTGRLQAYKKTGSEVNMGSGGEAEARATLIKKVRIIGFGGWALHQKLSYYYYDFRVESRNRLVHKIQVICLDDQQQEHRSDVSFLLNEDL